MKIKKINGKVNIIGKNLKKYRELSQKLELLGLTIYHTDIHKIEHQQKTVRDYELKAFCIVLQISFEELFEDTDKEYQ